MATQAQIEAVVDIVLSVFDGDPALFETSMTRVKLITELDDLNSQITNAQDQANADASANVAAIDALIALRDAKQDEIDALS